LPLFSEKVAPTLLLPSTKRRENPDQDSFVAAFQTPAALFGGEFVAFGLSHILRLSVNRWNTLAGAPPWPMLKH
jgi:hypothetical protein